MKTWRRKPDLGDENPNRGLGDENPNFDLGDDLEDENPNLDLEDENPNPDPDLGPTLTNFEDIIFFSKNLDFEETKKILIFQILTKT